ncbi:MAG TPA: hypothetical protein PK990_10140 [Salinivirgaceae bacterium]|nr:hypothetical protein [Salinivirgaceae bacterium]
MILENKDKAKKIKFLYLIVPIVIAITIIVFVVFGIDWGLWVIIPVSLVGILFLFFITQMKYYFIRAEIDSKKVNFKFYQITPFYTEYQSYDIRPDQLDSYEINRTFFGLVPQLILFVRTPKGKARYPALSLSAYNKIQRDQLERALNLVLSVNRSKKH